MKVLYYMVLSVWYLFSLLPLRVHYFISDLMFWLLYGLLGVVFFKSLKINLNPDVVAFISEGI